MAEVDNGDFRQLLLCNAFGQIYQVILAVHGVVKGLYGRRSRPQQGNGILLLSPDYGDVPGIVAQVAFLLVGGVVLLIHDKEADTFKRGKDS